MDRVTLTLAVARSRSPLEEKYYVVGDIAELGGWNEKKLMKRVRRGSVAAGAVRGGKERDAALAPSASFTTEEVDLFSFTFYAHRSKK